MALYDTPEFQQIITETIERLKNTPTMQAIIDGASEAQCELTPTGWVCRYSPDGCGPTRGAAQVDAVRRAVALLIGSALNRAAE